MEKICGQITVAAFMQPLQYDLRDPAAKTRRLVLRMQPQHEATLTSAIIQCDLQRLSCKTQQNYAQRRRKCSSKTGTRRQSEKKTILKHFLKGFLEGKSLAPKWRNLLTNHCRSLHAATPIRFTRSSCKRHDD